jgi:hypothetical protein
MPGGVSAPTARNAYTANRRTNAYTVMSGQATEITPTTTARMPRHSNDVDTDENMTEPPFAPRISSGC